MNREIWLQFLGLVHILNFYVYGIQNEIEIDSIHGVDNHSCLNNTYPCKSLHYVLVKSKIDLNYTDITLLGGKHPLNLTINLRNLRDFALKSSHSAVLSCSQFDGSINFLFSSNISIDAIKVENCGSDYESAGWEYHPHDHERVVRVAMNFAFCTNIRITNSRFVENSGLAVRMVNVNGKVEIMNSNFIANADHRIVKRGGRKNIISGGGISIKLTSCDAAISFNAMHPVNIWNCAHRSRYVINGNSFHSNYAEYNYHFISSQAVAPDDNTHFGKGGAINIDLSGDSSENSILINGCQFVNNSALWGGAIFVGFRNRSAKNVLVIQNGTFSHNRATIAGGGIRIESYEVSRSALKSNGNKIHFNQLTFYHNAAIWGGGLSISSTTKFLYSVDESARNINISNCKFFKNSATVGFAIGLATWNLNKDSVGSDMSYRVFIGDSNFEGNFMVLTEDKIVIGQGAVYAEEISLVLVGDNKFSKNSHTAICLDSSTLTFARYGWSDFYNNAGSSGGALSLYGNSWIILEEKCNVTFRNNTATKNGGAIYVKNAGPPRVGFQTSELLISNCFFRYEDDKVMPNDWPVSILFENNSAPEASGNSIYASTLKYCRQPGEGRNASLLFNWKNIKYICVGNHEPEVVTDAIDIRLNKSQWDSVPYLPFSADVAVYDEKHQNVYSSVKLNIDGNVSLDPPNDIFLIKNKIHRLRLLGKIAAKYSFSFFTTTGLAIETKKYNASLKPCLPGFVLDESEGKCICMEEQSSGVVRCYEDGRIYLLKGKWGYINSKTKLLETMICPQHYCSCPNEYEGYLCLYDMANQCANNRTGVLCSECKEGLSVTFGNESCKKCSNMYLLLFIPIILVLSLLICVIFHLNIDVFSGYLNAYLYCYQMILLLIPENVTLDRFISFIIGVTSLTGTGGNFGTCLYDGLNNLDKIFLNYVIPIYVVIFTLCVGIWIPQTLWEKLFCCCKSKIEESEVYSRNHSFGRALSFVLVICFSSFTSVTLKLLHWIEFDGKYVLYEAAFVRFFEGRHLYYFIVAIVMLIFVVIGFPVMLLFTPFFTYRFSSVQRVEPLFNALKNNFQDRIICRMFASFYFICRLVLLSISIFVPEQLTRLIVLSIASVIIQTIFSAVQPYKLSSFNYWDILLLTNMCIIGLLSLILSVPFTASVTMQTLLGILVQILVYLPLLSVIIRLIIWLKEVRDDSISEDDLVVGGTISRIRTRLLQKSNLPINVPARVTRDFDEN